MSDLKNIESWLSSRFENLFKEKRKLFNIPSIRTAIVDSVGSGVASVHFPEDPTNIISNIKIGTNVSATPTDEVLLLCLNGNIGNSYILTNRTMASTSGGGTITNGSNIGTSGTGVFQGLLGSVMQFYKIRAASSKATVTLNGTTNTVDIDVSESNLTHNNLGSLQGGNGSTEYYHTTSAEKTAITHSNRTNLDNINQDLGTSNAPSFSAITSTVAMGTPPLTVTSTTKVSNLNVEQLDGYDAGHSTGQIPISDGTVNTNLYGQYTQQIQDQRTGTGFLKTWYGTQAQYDAIGSKDSSTIYFISG